MSEEKNALIESMIKNWKYYVFVVIIIGFFFGLGYELATWIVDAIMQALGFPLG